MLVPDLAYAEPNPPRGFGVPDPFVKRWNVYTVKNGTWRIVGDYGVTINGNWIGQLWVSPEVYKNTTATSEEEMLTWMSTLYLLIEGEEP